MYNSHLESQVDRCVPSVSAFRLVRKTVAKRDYQLRHVCPSIHPLHRTTRHSREDNA